MPRVPHLCAGTHGGCVHAHAQCWGTSAPANLSGTRDRPYDGAWGTERTTGTMGTRMALGIRGVLGVPRWRHWMQLAKVQVSFVRGFGQFSRFWVLDTLCSSKLAHGGGGCLRIWNIFWGKNNRTPAFDGPWHIFSRIFRAVVRRHCGIEHYGSNGPLGKAWASSRTEIFFILVPKAYRFWAHKWYRAAGGLREG